MRGTVLRGNSLANNLAFQSGGISDCAYCFPCKLSRAPAESLATARLYSPSPPLPTLRVSLWDMLYVNGSIACASLPYGSRHARPFCPDT
eukprot:2241268-Pyramimonas_sp.AAC.1